MNEIEWVWMIPTHSNQTNGENDDEILVTC